MKNISISVWGDSVLEGVLYDEKTGRYIQNGKAFNGFGALNLDIKNYSRFGLTTAKAKKLFFDAMESDCSRGVIFEFGGNDCDYNWDEVSKYPQGEHVPKTPICEFVANIEEMISYTQKNGKKAFITTLPPLCSEAYLNFITRKGLSRENILSWLGDVEHIYRHHERYNNAVCGIAAKYGIPLIDIRDAFLKRQDYRSLICGDGIHPSAEGQKVICGVFADFYNLYALRHKTVDNTHILC